MSLPASRIIEQAEDATRRRQDRVERLARLLCLVESMTDGLFRLLPFSSRLGFAHGYFGGSPILLVLVPEETDGQPDQGDEH